MQKIVWTIAGSDPTSGAGIQNDLKTLQGFDVHGCSVVTAVTAQNHRGISHIDFLSADSIQAQIDQLQQEMPASAIKIGMLGTTETISTVMQCLTDCKVPLILDPVLFSSSGKKLFRGKLDDYLEVLQKYFPRITLLTPNRPEAEAILNRPLQSPDAIAAGAREILSLGVKSILIKGGHSADNRYSQDYWTDGNDSFWLSSTALPKRNYRGTGCMLSSAVTACLALEYELPDALVIAKMTVNRGIRLSIPAHQDTSLLHYAGWPEDETDLPYLTNSSKICDQIFLPCEPKKLGLYPIVDSALWISKLLSVGVKTLQLRIKHLQGNDLEREICESISMAKSAGANLFINDYWEQAIRFGAYGVHVGQQDIATADITAIRSAGMRLGVSTHCYAEVARAHALHPSYIAVGPIFPTTSKIMQFSPQGIENLKRWRRTLSYPLVAIGGITEERLQNILECNIDGVALISEITGNPDPLSKTKKLLSQVNLYDAHSS